MPTTTALQVKGKILVKSNISTVHHIKIATTGVYQFLASRPSFAVWCRQTDTQKRTMSVLEFFIVTVRSFYTARKKLSFCLALLVTSLEAFSVSV